MDDSNPFEFGPGSSVLRLALASQNARMAALQARSKAQDDDYRRMVADCKDMQLSAQELRAGRGGPSGPTKSPSRSPSHLRTRSQQEQIIDRTLLKPHLANIKSENGRPRPAPMRS